MVNFGGWDMPVEYSGILAEHEAVRTRAGLFDVSHMGEIEIRGHSALDLVQWVTCNNAAKLTVGQAQYSGLMTERGTFVDDLLVHKISDTHYLLCVNAGNQDRDFDHIVSKNRSGRGRGKCRAALLAAGRPGAAREGDSAEAHARDARPDPLLSLHVWQSERRRLPDRPHRLHWRRRLRNLFRS